MKIVVLATDSSLKNLPHTELSFLEGCVDMFAEYAKRGDLFIQAPADQANKIEKILPDIPVVVEPQAKGTAAAIGLAALHITQTDPEAFMAIVYSDHPVSYRHKLLASLKTAQKIAEANNKMVLIAVNPTFANTKYGYVKIGKVVQEINGIMGFEMAGFKEKPNQEQAQEFIHSWRYLWNTGYLVTRAQKLLDLYQILMPDLYKGLMSIKHSLGSKISTEITQTVFSTLENISMDKAIYEKANPHEMLIVPVDLHIHDFNDYSINNAK